MSRIAVGLALAAAAVIAGLPAAAGAVPLSARDSFRIGSGGGVLCTAESLGADRALSGMFDRGYAIVCRDAAVPVGRIYALRASGPDPVRRLAALRDEQAACGAPASAPLEGVGSVEVTDCKLKGADVAYRVYQARKGAILYSAEGFAGYDSALRLGLRSVIADKALPGELSIATTGVGDAAALARVQAGALDASRALAEAYRRNNTGSYAKSAEFFSSVSQGGDSQSAKAEGLSNEALQKSNLGRYDEADALFGRAAQLVGAEPDRRPAISQLSRDAPPEPRRSQGGDGRARQAGAGRPDGIGRQRQGAGDRRRDRRAPQRQSPASRRLGTSNGALLPEEKIADPRRPGASVARNRAQAFGRPRRRKRRPGPGRCQARQRPRRTGDFDHVDARPEPRRPGRGGRGREERRRGRAALRGERRAARGQLSRYRGAVERARPARRILRADRPGGEGRGACSATSSKARPMPASASLRSPACFSPMSKSCSRRAMTRTPSPTCSTRPRRSSGPASPRPRRSSRASSAAGATRRRGCSARRSTSIARSNGSGSSWRGSKRPPRLPTARG